MAQEIQITRAGKMTETIGFRNPQGLEKFVEAFAETETPPTENQILSFIKENPGAIMYIFCENKYGRLHDGPKGVVAVRQWDENGQLRYEEHYQNGQRHDGANGEAAVRQWDENGTRRYEAHYQNGKFNDGANGEAAARKWDENGQLRGEAHYQNGRLYDGANGTPALRRWDQNGKLTYAGRYGKGMLAREYKTPEELAAYEAEIKTKALATKLPPGMKFR